MTLYGVDQEGRGGGCKEKGRAKTTETTGKGGGAKSLDNRFGCHSLNIKGKRDDGGFLNTKMLKVAL